LGHYVSVRTYIAGRKCRGYN